MLTPGYRFSSWNRLFPLTLFTRKVNFYHSTGVLGVDGYCKGRNARKRPLSTRRLFSMLLSQKLLISLEIIRI